MSYLSIQEKLKAETELFDKSIKKIIVGIMNKKRLKVILVAVAIAWVLIIPSGVFLAANWIYAGVSGIEVEYSFSFVRYYSDGKISENLVGIGFYNDDNFAVLFRRERIYQRNHEKTDFQKPILEVNC
jgi:hypothetical protein